MNNNKKNNNKKRTTRTTYNRKSCSQYGSFPLTVTVVDFTFCNFNVTYVLNCVFCISALVQWHSNSPSKCPASIPCAQRAAVHQVRGAIECANGLHVLFQYFRPVMRRDTQTHEDVFRNSRRIEGKETK